MDDPDRPVDPLNAAAFDWGEEFDAREGLEADVLRFEAGELACAVDAEHVVEVALSPQVTLIPGLPPHVSGVAVRRRKVLSIINLAQFLHLPNEPRPTDRLVVLDVEGLEVGIVVSATSGLEMWPDDEDAPQPSDLNAQVRKYTLGTHWAPGGRVLLLDIPAILRDAAVT